MEDLTSEQFDEVMTALEDSHRQLVAHARTLPPEGAAGPTYCTEWSVAQVYSHLGSGAEIAAAAIRAVLTSRPPPDPRQIWTVWDARPPEAMISGFVDADRDLLDLLAGLRAEERRRVRLPMSAAMTIPFDLAVLMRLSEHALHSWDIRVGSDPRAEVSADAARLLAGLFPLDVLSLLLARQLAGRCGPAVVDIAITMAADERQTLRLTLGGGAALVRMDATPTSADAASMTGRIELPGPATWVRLLTGRLDADHRPADVHAEGVPTLDELWQALQEEPVNDLGAQSPA